MKTKRYLSQDDAATLSRLAEQLLRVRDVKFNAAENLIELISTSILLPANSRRKDCVSLYSKVTYGKVDTDERHTMMIVCPQDANQDLAQVSILAPIAMALIGAKLNSVVEVQLPFDQVHHLKILEIDRCSPAGGESDLSHASDQAIA